MGLDGISGGDLADLDHDMMLKLFFYSYLLVTSASLTLPVPCNNSPESCARLRQHAHCLGAQLQFIGEHIARVTGVVCPNLSFFEKKP